MHKNVGFFASKCSWINFLNFIEALPFWLMFAVWFLFLFVCDCSNNNIIIAFFDMEKSTRAFIKLQRKYILIHNNVEQKKEENWRKKRHSARIGCCRWAISNLVAYSVPMRNPKISIAFPIKKSFSYFWCERRTPLLRRADRLPLVSATIPQFMCETDVDEIQSRKKGNPSTHTAHNAKIGMNWIRTSETKKRRGGGQCSASFPQKRMTADGGPIHSGHRSNRLD